MARDRVFRRDGKDIGPVKISSRTFRSLYVKGEIFSSCQEKKQKVWRRY